MILKQCKEYIKNNRLKTFLAVLSGALICLAFPDNNIYLLEWLCFVPLLFACKNTDYRETYFLSLITGVVSTCGGYFWLTYLGEKFLGFPFPVNYAFWIFYSFYNAQLICLAFIGYKFVKKNTGLNDFIVFPAALVTFWAFFPNIFPVNLAHGMTYFPEALQASEFTGASGVDFIIALANITLLKILDKDSFKKNIIGIAISTAFVAGWIGYGYYAMDKWDNKIATWEKKNIGIVQPNRVSSNEKLPVEPGENLTNPFEMRMSEELAKNGAEVIIWPEGHCRGFLNRVEINDAYKKFVGELGVSVLFHDLPVEINNKQMTFRNANIWLNEKGEFADIYYKRRLVPFGEYMPVLNNFKSVVRSMNMPDIKPGRFSKVFDISGMKIQPLICYEIQFGKFVAKSAGAYAAGKVLLIQSNDGWYGNGAQSEQHRSSNILRAIETRLPLIHVINNGRSAVVTPNGRTIYLSNSWKREAENVMMPYNPFEGGSFYTKHPDLIFNIFRLMFVIFAIRLYISKRKKKDAESAQVKVSADEDELRKVG